MLADVKDIEIQGDLGGESYDMEIDENALSHFMKVLTDIYSDIKAAIVREYISNALDSHIDADQTRPIEVTAPNNLSPYFIVKDFGTGMSKDDIVKTFRKYGASTKRNSNKTTGRIGIGAKSALAYTNSFNVTSIKDGKKILVVVSYNNAGIGTTEIVSETDTTEENGVTITIPVNDRYDHQYFKDKADLFQKYAKRGIMLVDGKESTAKIEMISDKIGIIPDRSYYVKDMVVMGNVAYPINDYKLDDALHNYQVIYYVDMGEIQFTPSREELQTTPKTIETLKKYRELLVEQMVPRMQAQVDACTSYSSAYHKAQNNMSSVFSGTLTGRIGALTYKGESIPEDLNDNFDMKAIRWNMQGSKSVKSHACNVTPTDDTLYIKNYDLSRFSKVHAAKLDAYLEQENITLDRPNHGKIITRCEDEDLFKWYDDGVIIDWKDVAPIKVSLPVTSQEKKEKKWEGAGGGQVYGKHIPDITKKIYFCSKSHLSGRNFYSGRLDEYIDDDTQLFMVTDSERSKFIKKYPTAKHLSSWYGDRVEELIAELTDEEFKAVETARFDFRYAKLVIVNDIVDPELAAALDNDRTIHYRNGLEKISKIKDLMYRVDYNRKPQLQAKLPNSNIKAKILEQRYPLLFQTANQYVSLNSDNPNYRSHMTEYANMIHAKKEKKV